MCFSNEFKSKGYKIGSLPSRSIILSFIGSLGGFSLNFTKFTSSIVFEITHMEKCVHKKLLMGSKNVRHLKKPGKVAAGSVFFCFSSYEHFHNAKKIYLYCTCKFLISSCSNNRHFKSHPSNFEFL